MPNEGPDHRDLEENGLRARTEIQRDNERRLKADEGRAKDPFHGGNRAGL